MFETLIRVGSRLEKLGQYWEQWRGASLHFRSLYPTANCFYPYIVKVKRALIEAQKSEDTYLRSMGAAMLDKFDKYWEEKNNVMVIATILDPRFKMRYIKWCFA